MSFSKRQHLCYDEGNRHWTVDTLRWPNWKAFEQGSSCCQTAWPLSRLDFIIMSLLQVHDCLTALWHLHGSVTLVVPMAYAILYQRRFLHAISPCRPFWIFHMSHDVIVQRLIWHILNNLNGTSLSVLATVQLTHRTKMLNIMPIN